MAFRGFLVESKAYLDYDAMTLRGKARFWFDYPRAAAIFYFYAIYDPIRLAFARRFGR